MRIVETADRLSYRRMTTNELRAHFLVTELFQPGKAELVYTDVDRAVVGGLVPLASPLVLTGGPELASRYFCERREAGVFNLGGAGNIAVDGHMYPMAARECLYIGRGAREISFASESAAAPAQFYLVSYPAHAEHPVTLIPHAQARHIEAGAPEDANRRTIHQFIHLGGVRSCQLVMGYTELHTGSVWNTFPPHTHPRRTEVYCYFDLPPDGQVLHMLGAPDETRHLVVREKQVALSPPWSIHSGVGVGRYRFVWAMGGENQVFDDMDKVVMDTFR